MIIEFIDGFMFVKHPSGHMDTYNKADVKQLKTQLEQDLLELKVDIARHNIYLKSMSESKPTILAKVFTKLFRKA